MDITNFRRIHMLGIKGAGMAALAVILKKRGIIICGSDVEEEFFTDALLKNEGISVERFGACDLTNGINAVVYSTAYPTVHPECEKATTVGIPVISYPQALAAIFNTSLGIAVSGSHGKTTTSALLAYVFYRLGKNPTALVGSEIRQLKTNALVGTSEYFILEADEYQNKFFHLDPKALIVTAIDYDHPDFFKTVDEYVSVFTAFAQKVKNGFVCANWDDEHIRFALKDIFPIPIRYGSDLSYDYAMQECRVENECTSFFLYKSGRAIRRVSLRLLGCHNASNVVAVFALCDALGIGPHEDIITAIEEFEGTRRRFEVKGKIGKTTIIDDYAHHPTEVRVTLEAARKRYGQQRIWCAFGPHTFSRTETFFHEFAQSFSSCDALFLLDIYGSAREKLGTIHASDLTDAIRERGVNVHYAGSIESAVEMIRPHLSEVDIFITMGAGDAWKIGEKLLSS